VPQPIRLRQIALVARDLAAVEPLITTILATPVCFRDPGVAKYGLHNALWALGGTFLEVVAPVEANTTAGRFLDRRDGDGGYMFIADCPDLAERRAHILAQGTRIVQDLAVGDADLMAEALHLHPRDTGGCLLSLDRHGPDSTMLGSYGWAGSAWHALARRDVQIMGATMQCDDPAAVAARWSHLLELPATDDDPDMHRIALSHGHAQFVPLGDERGEGLSGVTLGCDDPHALRANADRAGVETGADWFDLCGVRFTLQTSN
jgi:hypothetical protein